MRIFALLFAGFLGLGQSAEPPEDAAPRPVISPFPLTHTEMLKARALAESMLTDWQITVSTNPEFYQVEGLDIKDPRLGDPFLDVTLRGRSLDDYRDSAVDDPRLFTSVLYYAFPVYVPSETDPVVTMVVVRNRNEDGNKFNSEDGDVFTMGYFMRGPGRTLDAVRLRNKYGGRISYVSFLDTSIPTRIIVEDSTGVRSGFSEDSLVTMAKDARRIKRYLKHQRFQRDY